MVPVCPPPSPPWAMTALAPMSATFSAWRGAPTVTTVATPASRSRRHLFGARRSREAGDRDAPLDDERDPLCSVGLARAAGSHRMGCRYVRAPCRSRLPTPRTSWSRMPGSRARRRRPWQRSDEHPRPTPSRSARSGSGHRRGRWPWSAEPGAERVRAPTRPTGSRVRHLGVPQTRGIESLELLVLLGCRQAGLGHLVGHHQVASSDLEHLIDGHSRMDRAQRHGGDAVGVGLPRSRAPPGR